MEGVVDSGRDFERWRGRSRHIVAGSLESGFVDLDERIGGMVCSLLYSI